MARALPPTIRLLPTILAFLPAAALGTGCLGAQESSETSDPTRAAREAVLATVPPFFDPANPDSLYAACGLAKVPGVTLVVGDEQTCGETQNQIDEAGACHQKIRLDPSYCGDQNICCTLFHELQHVGQMRKICEACQSVPVADRSQCYSCTSQAAQCLMEAEAHGATGTWCAQHDPNGLPSWQHVTIAGSAPPPAGTTTSGTTTSGTTTSGTTTSGTTTSGTTTSGTTTSGTATSGPGQNAMSCAGTTHFCGCVHDNLVNAPDRHGAKPLDPACDGFDKSQLIGFTPYSEMCACGKLCDGGGGGGSCGGGSCGPGAACGHCPNCATPTCVCLPSQPTPQNPGCSGACPSCGDGKCEGVESCDSCAADCGPCNVCGNAECDPKETHETCPHDCAAPVPVPTSTTVQ